MEKFKMGKWSNAIGHFKTITNHKMIVMKYCFKAGLYKQGLLHDLSKYSFGEFKTGINYYKGTYSPNTAEKKENGYSSAWLHHKGRNKHHFEYWIDYGIRGEDGLLGMKMPTKYVVEMFIDRVSASKNYQGDKYTDKSALIYYNDRKHFYVMHENTIRILEELLNMLDEKGEEVTFKYIREELLKNS